MSSMQASNSRLLGEYLVCDG